MTKEIVNAINITLDAYSIIVSLIIAGSIFLFKKVDKSAKWFAYTNIAAIQPLVLETGFEFENSNPANFMTLDNIVMICDNIVVNGNYVKDSVFLTLQNLVMAPSTTIRIPIVVYSDDNY